MKKISLAAILFFLLSFPAFGYETFSEMVEMNDGTELYTRIVLPENEDVLPAPAVLIRTPYGADLNFNINQLLALYIVDIKGYALVFQDKRGRNKSGGRDSLFLEDGWGDKKDGYETIEWIAAQDWCDGKVGMYGPSALAISQYLAAGACPPHLECGVPIVGSWNLYHDAVYPGGQYRQSDINLWVNNFSRPEMMEKVKENYKFNEMWASASAETKTECIEVPFLHITGWYDFFFPGPLNGYYDLQYRGAEGARGHQKLIIGPWTHTTVDGDETGEFTFSEAEDFTMDYMVNFFDYWLMGRKSALEGMADVSLFLMGPHDTTGHWNKWYYFNGWPFEETDTLTFYMNGENGLSTEKSDQAGITYMHYPVFPFALNGGNNMLFSSGPRDQQNVIDDGVNDHIFLESEEFINTVEIFGQPQIELYLSSDRVDTDVSAALLDIYPDGRMINICDGYLMARYRNGFDNEELMEPGEIYRIGFDLNYTAYALVKGHKLGIALSSANWPKFAINPGTGEPPHQATDTFRIENTVHFRGETHSRLILPVMEKPLSVAAENRSYDILSVSTFNSVLNVDLADFYPDKYLIYDVNGKLIAEDKTMGSDSSINIGFDYPHGVYFMILKSADKSKLVKISHTSG